MADLYDLTPSISLQLPQRGYFANIWDFPLNSNFVILDRLFSGTSVGGGHGHTGVSGDGPRLDHNDLLNIGVANHDDIDTHIADTTLHSDTKIGVVEGDVNATATTVSNVSTLQFANATVSQTASGVALVTVTPNYGNGAPLYAKPESAPSGYTDNFNWPSGTNISSYSWIVDKGSNVNDPEFVINQPGATGAPGYKANLHIGSVNGAVTGGMVNHVLAHVPHGPCQRVTAHVPRLRPTFQNGTAVPANVSTAAVNYADSITLELHLMARTEYSGNPGIPLKCGLSFNIRKRPTAAGPNVLAYTVIVRSSTTATPVSFSLPSGVWQAKPFEYFEGTHEFSLKRHSTIASAYYLQYYYNEGLVWSELFLPNSAVATAIDALQATLALSNGASAVVGGENPTFGRIGFAFGYSLVEDQEYDIDIQHVTVASQDDLDVIKPVYLPTPQGGTPPPPPSPLPVAACDGGTFSSLVVGDPFAFDGGNPNDWSITSRFESGQAPGGSNGPGFIVTSRTAPESWYVFCSAPTATQLTTPQTFNPNNINGSIKLNGLDLMRGPYTQVRFLAGSAFSWLKSNGGLVTYAPGDEVDTRFIGVSTSLGGVVAANSDADPTPYVTIHWTSGNQLPWGALLDIELTAAYESTYVDTWTSALEVRPARPLTTSTSAYVYDTVDSTPPAWVAIPALTGEFVEGSDIFIALVARNLPLGSGFWAAAASAGGWPLDWRIGDTGTALTLLTDTALTAPTVYYTQLRPASFDPSSTLIGTPPVAAIPSGQHPSITYTNASTFAGETFTAIVNFPVGTWKDLYNATGGVMNDTTPLYSLRLADPITGAFTVQQRPLLVRRQILPRDPIIVDSTISTTEEGQIADITIDLMYLDADVLTTSMIESVVELNLLEGFTVLGLASQYSAIDQGNGVIRISCAGCGTLAAAGADIRVQVKNVAAYNWIQGEGAAQAAGHALTGEVTTALGVTSNAPLTDIVLWNDRVYSDSGTTTEVELYEDQDITCYAKLANITVTGTLPSTQSDVRIKFHDTNAPNSVFTYFRLVGAPVFSDAGGGYYLVEFTVRTIDSSSQIPGPASTLEVHFTRVANASVAVSVPITVVDTKDPSFVNVTEVDPEGPSVRLGLTTGTMQSGPTSNVWDMSQTGWEVNGSTVVMRIRALDAQDNAILQLIQPNASAPSLEFVDDIGGSLGSLAQGVWLNTGATPPSGVDRDIGVRLLPDAATGDVIGLTITNPSLSGEDHSVTDVASISITTTNIPGGGGGTDPGGAGTGIGGTDGEALLGSGSNVIGLFPTSIASIVIYQPGGGIFQTTPVEGQFFEFIIPGSFVIDNPGDPTDAFTVEFMTLDGDYLATSVVLTAASTSQLVGSARALPLTAGSRITVRVSESSTGDVVALVTDQYMLMEPTPVITSTYGQVEEASTDVSVLFYGFDLFPRIAPVGQPVFLSQPVFEVFNSGPTDYLSGDSYVLGDDVVTITFDVAADSAGETIGVRITTLGGREYTYANLLTIQEAYTTPPTVESLVFYNASDQALIDNSADVTIDPPVVSVDGVARLMVTGTELTLRNVADAYLEIVGESDAGSLHIETPPGPGLAPRLKANLTNRIYRLSTISQSATVLVLEFPAVPDLANARARLHLIRPDDHPSGAGDWGDEIDNTGEGDLGGITAYGMTVKYGTTVTGFQLNKDTTVSNNTQYAAAKAAQANVSNGYGGYSFSITLRFESALTGAVPEIISVPDPDYGTEFTIGPATLSANRFEMTFDVTVPLPGVGNTYPDYCSPGYSPSPSPWPPSPSPSPPIQDGSPSPSPGTCPFDPRYVSTACGLRLANGQSILSVVLGRADWGEETGQVT